MSYAFSEGPRAVTFTRRRGRGLFSVLIVVGVALLVGALLWLRASDTSRFLSIFLQTALAIGALFVLVGVRARIAGEDYEPSQIAFDAGRGAVRLPGAVEIPFGDIEGLDVRKAVAAERRDGAITTPTAYHHFVIVKTAAADFEVFQTTDFAEVERVVTAIRACLAKGDGTTVAAPVLPATLASTVSGEATTLRWRNKAAGDLVTFIAAATAIGFVLSRFALLFATEGVIPFLVLGFMGLILAFIVVTEVRKYVHRLRTSYELSVTPSALRYSEVPGRSVAVPTGPDLEVRFEHQLDERRRPIVVRSNKAEFALDTGALSAADRVQLARWLKLKTSAASYR